MTTLLPCPFCGEAPDVDDPGTFQLVGEDELEGAIACCILGPIVWVGIDDWLDDEGDEIGDADQEDAEDMNDDWKQRAIDAWNTRKEEG